jgi:hypothetical protein
MRVLVKPVGEAPFFHQIDDLHQLAGMQAIVGGNIELIRLASWFPSMNGTELIDCWCDEEGKLKEGWYPDRINFYLGEGEHEKADAAVGTIFFSSHDDEGETLAITDEQVVNICDYFKWTKPVMT